MNALSTISSIYQDRSASAGGGHARTSGVEFWRHPLKFKTVVLKEEKFLLTMPIVPGFRISNFQNFFIFVL